MEPPTHWLLLFGKKRPQRFDLLTLWSDELAECVGPQLKRFVNCFGNIVATQVGDLEGGSIGKISPPESAILPLD